VRRYWKTEEPESLRPLTVDRRILSKIFYLAIKYGITHSNPCRDIPWLPENNKRMRYLFDEEEPKLFAILTGRRRRGDQLNLRWEKVDFQP
jgi:hypothetical protein